MRVTLRFLQAIVCQIVSAVNTGLQARRSVGRRVRSVRNAPFSLAAVLGLIVFTRNAFAIGSA